MTFANNENRGQGPRQEVQNRPMQGISGESKALKNAKNPGFTVSYIFGINYWKGTF